MLKGNLQQISSLNPLEQNYNKNVHEKGSEYSKNKEFALFWSKISLFL